MTKKTLTIVNHLLTTLMQILNLSNQNGLRSSSIDNLVVSDSEVVVQFTSGPKVYTYGIATGATGQDIADEFSNSTSAGRTFNALLANGNLIAV